MCELGWFSLGRSHIIIFLCIHIILFIHISFGEQWTYYLEMWCITCYIFATSTSRDHRTFLAHHLKRSRIKWWSLARYVYVAWYWYDSCIGQRYTYWQLVSMQLVHSYVLIGLLLIIFHHIIVQLQTKITCYYYSWCKLQLMHATWVYKLLQNIYVLICNSYS